MDSAAVEASFLDKQWKSLGEVSSCIAIFLSNRGFCGGGFPCLCSLMASVFFSFSLLTLLSLPSLTQTDPLHQGSRRRQKGSDYTSTSDDDEYDSKQSTPKNKRSQPSSALHSPRPQPRPRPQPVVALHPKQASKESEDNKHEGEALHNWSNHSAEIAR